MKKYTSLKLIPDMVIVTSAIFRKDGWYGHYAVKMNGVCIRTRTINVSRPTRNEAVRDADNAVADARKYGVTN